MVARTSPPFSGSVWISEQGIVASKACGVWAISGAVTDAVSSESCWPVGHSMVAVDCLTGSRGEIAQNAIPTRPATIATQRTVPALGR